MLKFSFQNTPRWVTEDSTIKMWSTTSWISLIEISNVSTSKEKSIMRIILAFSDLLLPVKPVSVPHVGSLKDKCLFSLKRVVSVVCLHKGQKRWFEVCLETFLPWALVVCRFGWQELLVVWEPALWEAGEAPWFWLFWEAGAQAPSLHCARWGRWWEE